MVGLLIADNTPAKPKKKTVEVKKRNLANSRADNTDSEGEENGGKGGAKKSKKDEVEAKIVLPKNIKYLKRFVKRTYTSYHVYLSIRKYLCN
jgi:NurA-like 5'-3' nuclease